jgi:threonine synthase
LLQAHENGSIASGLRVVCTVTGHGLKDPEWAIAGAPAPITIAADVDAAAAALDL